MSTQLWDLPILSANARCDILRRYASLAQALPTLIQDTQAVDSVYAPVEAAEAARLLAQVYQIASALLRKVGELELSWLAADRAIAVSQRAGDSDRRWVRLTSNQLLTGQHILTGGTDLFSRNDRTTVDRFQSVIDLGKVTAPVQPPP